MKKGFYFSFDALMALTVLSISLVVVTQSGSITFDDYRAGEVAYHQSSTSGQDAMRLASRESFQVYNESFQQELVAETVMEEEDLDRTVLDGVSLLWAARNITHARTAAKTYFSDKLDSEFRLEVTEGVNATEIYQTSEDLEDAETVSSSTRLVSGHSIDRPSEGFQARARAVEAVTNQTKIVDIPMMGSGGYTNTLEVDRDFYVPAQEGKIDEAEMYISMQWGESHFNSATLEINGETAIEEDDMSVEDDDKAHYGFGKVDVTDYVEEGWNHFNLVFPNQDSQNDYHAHIQPGTRIEVVYTQDTEKVKSRDWEYLTDVRGEATNVNHKGGVWYNYPLQVPGDGDVGEAVLELDIRNLQDQSDDDLQVFVNDEQIVEKSAEEVDDVEVIEFQDYLEPKTNVLSIYGNVELEDGRIEDFTHEGDEDPRIYSDPIEEEGSRVKVDFESPGEELEFGLIDIRWTEEIGGEIEEPISFGQNPAYFNQTYDEEFEIINSFLNVAQLNSINVTHTAGIDEHETIFESPRTYATPSRIETGEELVAGGETTEYWFQDECFDGEQRDHCDILPESGLEVEIGLPSQVGYGRLFDNRSSAVDDAERRLEEQLGQFAEATDIEDDTLSTGGQPYLWGPATVRLVIWDE